MESGTVFFPHLLQCDLFCPDLQKRREEGEWFTTLSRKEPQENKPVKIVGRPGNAGGT
jgi:hypothetical protein